MSMDRDRIRRAIKDLAPVTYIVTVPGHVAVAVSDRAMTDRTSPEHVIADAIKEHVGEY